MSLDDVGRTLLDDRPLPVRLLRLQGLRGDALDQGLAAGWSVRLGPAICAGLGLVALIIGAPMPYLLIAALSAVGAFLPNHPIELVYVAWARRTGRTPPPPNRAARRFACLAAAGCFVLAGWGAGGGPSLLYPVMGTVMVALPAFVAATNLCVPSLIFTLLFGTEAATCPTLGAAVGSRSPSLPPQRGTEGHTPRIRRG